MFVLLVSSAQMIDDLCPSVLRIIGRVIGAVWRHGDGQDVKYFSRMQNLRRHDPSRLSGLELSHYICNEPGPLRNPRLAEDYCNGPGSLQSNSFPRFIFVMRGLPSIT